MKLSKALIIGLMGAGLMFLLYAIAFAVGVGTHIYALVGANIILSTAILMAFFGEKFPAGLSMGTIVSGVTLMVWQFAHDSMLVGMTYLSQTSQTCLTYYQEINNNTLNPTLPPKITCDLPQQEFILATLLTMFAFVISLLVVGYLWVEFNNLDYRIPWAFGFAAIIAVATYDLVQALPIINIPPFVLNPVSLFIILGIGCLVTAAIIAVFRGD